MRSFRTLVVATAAIATAPAFSTLAQAQNFPARTIRLVVPYAPGGSQDTIGRLVSGPAGAALGQPMIVENKAGAGSLVGADAVAKSAPDGYTLLLASPAAITVAPAVRPSMPYDPAKDFAPVSFIAEERLALFGAASMPANRLSDVLALLKAKPDALNYGSAGQGSMSHMVGELFKVQSGTQIVHVPYSGAGPSVAAVVSGQVSLAFQSGASMAGHLTDKRVKVFAVASATRSAQLPDVPTMAEAGLPGVEAPLWVGIVAPAGTPAPVVARLQEAFRRATLSDEVQGKLKSLGVEVIAGDAAQLATMIRQDSERWKKVAAQSKIKID